MKSFPIAAFVIFSLHLLAFAQVPPAARPSPSPSPNGSSPTSQKPVKSLSDIQSFIRERLARPEVSRGRVGVKIVSLNTGKVVYEQDADKYFMPASNMKNFT